mmetsp:Transcript_20122/g.77153  ORF Transcript_20122/g.77153 Transcript_20122/m.77153 type:complete len:217 (-) Transcript_20122:394-1044(-)
MLARFTGSTNGVGKATQQVEQHRSDLAAILLCDRQAVLEVRALLQVSPVFVDLSSQAQQRPVGLELRDLVLGRKTGSWLPCVVRRRPAHPADAHLLALAAASLGHNARHLICLVTGTRFCHPRRVHFKVLQLGVVNDAATPSALERGQRHVGWTHQLGIEVVVPLAAGVSRTTVSRTAGGGRAGRVLESRCSGPANRGCSVRARGCCPATASLGRG